MIYARIEKNVSLSLCFSRSTLSLLSKTITSYLRRRRDFVKVAYQSGYDALRGRIRDRTRRGEGQQRGYRHDHICEWAEPCGMRCASSLLEGREFERPFEQCHCCSRYCLMAGKHSVLDPSLNGSPVHATHHAAPVQAELCRPWPIG